MLLGNGGSFLSRGKRRSLFCSSKTKYGVCPTTYIMGKRPGRKAKNSPPSIAQLKNAGSYTTTPPYLILMDVTECIPLYLNLSKTLCSVPNTSQLMDEVQKVCSFQHFEDQLPPEF
jgi:hypothetical protein